MGDLNNYVSQYQPPKNSVNFAKVDDQHLLFYLKSDNAKYWIEGGVGEVDSVFQRRFCHTIYIYSVLFFCLFVGSERILSMVYF